MYPLGAYLWRTEKSSICDLSSDSKSRTRWGLGGRKCKPKRVCGAPLGILDKLIHQTFFKTSPSMNQMESISSSLSCLLMDDREMGVSVYQPTPSNTNGNLERRYLPATRQNIQSFEDRSSVEAISSGFGQC